MEDVGLALTLRGAVTSPSMKLLVATERHFRMFVVRADHSRNVCTRWHAEFFFFCVEARTACVARAQRPPCTAVVMSVSVWPFQQGASHRCASFHTLQKLLYYWTVGSTFLRLPPDPLLSCLIFSSEMLGDPLMVFGWVRNRRIALVWGSRTRSQRHHSLAPPVRSTSASVALLDQGLIAPKSLHLFLFSVTPPKKETSEEKSQRLKKAKLPLRKPISTSVCRACEVVQRWLPQ